MQSPKQLNFYSHYCKNDVCSQTITSCIVWNLYLSYSIKKFSSAALHSVPPPIGVPDFAEYTVVLYSLQQKFKEVWKLRYK